MNKTMANLKRHQRQTPALRALEQKFTSKIKGIYVKSPFYTGSAFDDYDDGM